MTTPSIEQQIEDAYNAYNKFDTGQKKTDSQNFESKLGIFKGLSGNPSFILMMFFTTILASNDVKHGPFPGNESSYTRNQENDLTEVSKELNYASAYRNAVSDLKEQLENGKGGSGPSDPQTVLNDIQDMETYMDAGKFSPDAPEIFENSSSTFSKSFDAIKAVVDKVNSDYGGSFKKLWDASEKQGDKEAGGLIQSFTNATDTLFSAVGVQQNVLNTRLQDIESNYKSILAVVTQGMKAFFSVITNALQKMSTS